MRAKSGVSYCELNNFDETGFIMGVICLATRADGPEWPQDSDVKIANLFFGNPLEQHASG